MIQNYEQRSLLPNAVRYGITKTNSIISQYNTGRHLLIYLGGFRDVGHTYYFWHKHNHFNRYTILTKPSMSPEQFFDLLLKELEVHTEMQPYYKFLGNQSSWHFRRNYFLQRLRYIHKYLVAGGKPDPKIWDCGCGYGTTCLYLAMNGIASHGTTLEFYYETVQKRREYWSRYGDTSLFTCSYENLFDNAPAANSYDWIIVQDTLHHLEPINDALQIFHNALRPGGRVLSIEENGSNIIQRAKLYKYRGNKRIISIWDEKLQKEILIGNENIRSMAAWRQLFVANHFAIADSSVQYVRYYLPVSYRFSDAEKLLQQEEAIQSTPGMRREYLFFGLNFVAEKRPGKV